MRTLHYSIFPDLRCREHGIWDGFPCPWPGCPNGIPEDRFRVDPLLEGKQADIYTRREWHSLSGESYYSWDGSDLPNWFGASEVIANEARRNGLITERFTDLIYHYTSVEGLFGILQSRQIWLSDYSYLNDTRELSHGADLVVEVIEELLKSESRTEVISLLQQWKAALAAPVHRVCIASFSAAGDSLSQWRAYGPIALGFEPGNLTLHAFRANLRPVEYERKRQRALVEAHLHHTREAYLVDLRANRLERIEDIYHKTDRIIELVSFFKDPAFESEHEYRLAYIEHPDLMKSLGGKPSKKRFRIARGRIVPYVLSSELEPKTLDNRKLEIREIILGPESDEMLERGIREFLLETGMSGVEVKRSIVPYRT